MPGEVIVMHADRNRPIRKSIRFSLDWIRLHRKGLLLILLIIVLCALSALITAYHPT